MRFYPLTQILLDLMTGQETSKQKVQGTKHLPYCSSNKSLDVYKLC